MAVDIFLQIDGVKGESKDSKYKDEIDVLGWSWGMSQLGTSHLGGGSGGGKVNVNDLTFTKYFDKATPVLMEKCAIGKHIDKATLVMRKAGGTQEPYLTIKMEKVFVTSVQPSGSPGEEKPIESISLNFAKFDVSYDMQDDKGIMKNAGGFKYNIEENKAG